jgi:FAD/FMN-containing dehydrogenase
MTISRRTFLESAGLVTLASTSGCFTVSDPRRPVLVNDVHTQLNPTLVRSVSPVGSLGDLRRIIRRARREHRPVSVAGGRHAAGGQQFATDAELIDTHELRRVLRFDPKAGMIEVETGIQWPEFMAFLSQARGARVQGWTVAQKQTGTDQLSIGGALSANAHGRGLSLPPFISNVESIVLMDANGDCHTCDRQENSQLFKLAIGGYGLFGFVYSAKLRLVPLRKVRRVVRLLQVAELPAAFAERIRDGFLYGDFQFAIDSKSDDFLHRGIFACYEPVAEAAPLPSDQKKLSAEDWKMLLYLAHTNPTRGFELYAKHYLATSGQIYWSDKQYVSDYFKDYHRELDARLHASEPATEVIGELNVPRDSLPHFLGEAREQLRASEAPPLIYGTVRLIEKDTESFLPWAKESYACVIFNLHTPHTPEGLSRTSNAFRQLIDLTIRYGGSYYLTYHRYATREQVLACYPQFPEFLRLKLHYDPEERFQSDWYRHYKRMFA